ncbi:MAG: hypothetical protein JO270_08645 [Acidobacteriaceae bacterium]|nr:hypothetical protein [Acidobacteriaceae bacterium]MBV8569175.1 hypothetical protein [Acidobacteriaceae bacterium]
MSIEPSAAASGEDADWPRNYFNYFTEIEDHFQRARGTGLFLLSPLDWALIESWKNSGVPLEAVLKGVDDAFENWRRRKIKRRLVNSLAYCAQAVLEAARRAPVRAGEREIVDAPFSPEELQAHLDRSASAIRRRPGAPFDEVAQSLESLARDAENQLNNAEDLERRLTVLEEKLVAALRAALADEDLYALRENLDRELRPYRSSMSAEQLSMLERRYLDTALLERAGLPRLSLFYLH